MRQESTIHENGLRVSNDYEESVEVKREGIDDYRSYDDVQEFLDIFEDTYEKYGNKLLEAKNDIK